MKYINIKDIEGSSKKELYFEDRVHIGNVYQEVDGFYVFDPKREGGVWQAHSLREIADILDNLNKPWEEHIENFFKSLPKEEFYDPDVSFDNLDDK
jgi:hypothetical protein